eukprot:GGOE01014146.1.p1 GENE.GGOE01014146.1~~GGOE01014146.1.p1  ORF type:complete len:285 (-),score=85.93 GGOE01014146.1:178-978(-)
MADGTPSSVRPQPDLLAEFTAHFEAQVAQLQGLQLLSEVADGTALAARLRALDQLLGTVEGQCALLRGFLAEDAAAVEDASHLVSAAKRQQTYVSAVRAALPQRLPGTAPSTTATGPAPGAPPMPGVKTPRKRSASAAMLATPLEKRMAYVTVDELEGAPKYLAGRLTLDRVNAVVDELHCFLAEKYQLLRLPYRKVPQRQFRRWQAFQADEVPDTKGQQFCTDSDLRTFQCLKLDQTGRNILTVLRHLGRLREVRTGAVTRYIVA